VHFVGFIWFSLLKMHGPKKQNIVQKPEEMVWFKGLYELSDYDSLGIRKCVIVECLH